MTYAQRTIRVKITLNGEEIKEDRPRLLLETLIHIDTSLAFLDTCSLNCLN